MVCVGGRRRRKGSLFLDVFPQIPPDLSAVIVFEMEEVE
jgi:hypothetical protein